MIDSNYKEAFLKNILKNKTTSLLIAGLIYLSISLPVFAYEESLTIAEHISANTLVVVSPDIQSKTDLPSSEIKDLPALGDIKEISDENSKEQDLFKSCCYCSGDYSSIFAQEGFHIALSSNDPNVRFVKTQRLVNYSKDDVYLNSIPKILHQIWFSSPNNPREIAKTHVEKTINAAKELKKYGWKSILWTNIPLEKMPETKKMFEDANLDIEIRHLSDKLVEQKCQEMGLDLEIIDNLITNKKFGMVSDAVRIIVVNVYGGLYRDLDYDIYQPSLLDKVLSKYDFASGMDSDVTLGNAFIAAKPNHPITNKLVERLGINLNPNKQHLWPDYLKTPCNFFSETIMRTGPAIFTVITRQEFNKDGNRDIVFGRGVIFSYYKAEALKKGEKDIDPDLYQFHDFNDEDYKDLQALGNDEYGMTWSKVKANDTYPCPKDCPRCIKGCW